MDPSHHRPTAPSLREAADALAALLRDPDETAHVFTILSALGDRVPARLAARFRRTPEGRALLRDKPVLIEQLLDRQRLRALPEGTLGRAYLAFMEQENISADGLVEASLAGHAAPHEDERFVLDRLRDTHDLWHTATGYHGDVLGEAALLAFSWTQTLNPGIVAIVVLGMMRFRSVDYARLVAGGLWRGVRASDLTVVRWEELLDVPLEEVRRQLGITAAPDYVPLRTETLRAEGRLAERPMAHAA